MDSQLRALNVIDFATLTCSSTAVVSLADGTPALATGMIGGILVRRVLISTETADVRWRADGDAPTAGTGHVLASGDTISFTGANYRQLLKAIQFHTAGTSTSNLSITYFD